MKPVYKCKLMGIDTTDFGSVVAKVRLLGTPSDSYLRTSPILSIDFERGVCITLNSIYQFEPTVAA